MPAKKRPNSSRPQPILQDKRRMNSIVRLYQSGCTINEIKQKERVHEANIRKILIFRGIPTGLLGRLTRFPVTDPNFLDKYTDSVCEMYKSGASMLAIADQKQISRDIVRELLARRNVPHFSPGPRKTQIDADTANDIVNLYQTGLSVRQVHDQTKVSKHTIEAILRERQVRIRSRGRTRTTFNQLQLDMVARLYQTGLSIIQVSAKTNLSQYLVKQALKLQNISIRTETTNSSIDFKVKSETTKPASCCP